ncbi:cell wall hydrolase [Sphingomonas morindae]|uniref:Cell wall hydrolase n=1 Tax=Sphingomonas morindae TaxID=1541170 RepID=A0ABY4XAL1_9SPHN|nr:cell wall hydrolase [Sphingomonas morindae]USI73706.1 cell wall hydrolase [Sphingomonas morindae]
MLIARRDYDALVSFALICAFALALLTIGRQPPPARHGVAPSALAGAPAAAPAGALLPPPPAVEPIDYAAMSADEARAYNAGIPFVANGLEAARPFIYTGSPADRAAARACLAAAMLYEAGDDRTGERAVGQVVLNRLRHPAFPKTVCGVVFQGAERSTGCQFTFTCDGALERPPLAAAWARASALADAALSGSVDRDVGLATHYHANYVVPYWRGSLDKIAGVGAHIFYRWTGWWGTRGAFAGRLQPLEPIDARLVALAGPGVLPGPQPGDPLATPGDAPATATATAAAPPPPPPSADLEVEGVPRRMLRGAIVRLKDEQASQFVVQLPADAHPNSFAMTGFSICADRPDCLVMGWTEQADLPRALPVMPIDQRRMAFTYRKSSALGIAQPRWDCSRFVRAAAGECLPGTGR